jgi:predicted helicase
VRANPKLSGTKHNVFGIQTGVAISFLVKREKSKECRIFYSRRPEIETAEDKLGWLSKSRLGVLPQSEIRPDAKHNWLNLTDNDFDSLIPIASKTVKASSRAAKDKAIFKLFSLGVVTARDEWVYGETSERVLEKIGSLIGTYNSEVEKGHERASKESSTYELNSAMKWSRAVKRDLTKGIHYKLHRNHVIEALYRPFVKSQLYFDKQLNEVQYQLPSMFSLGENPTITFLCVSSSNPLAAMAVEQPFDYCLLKMGNGGTQAVSRFAADEDGKRIDNITDWALKQFKDRYQPGKGKKAQPITKDAIFHYVYAVLHDPLYREKYALNLKREFPRIPFYPDFWQWSAWGKTLMDLHIGYEQVLPWPLKRVDIPDEKTRKNGGSPKAVLKADKDAGRIALDSETSLLGIPPEAWAYKLGNRCALEWILDQYKEKTPKDPTIRARFNTYRFADYKDKVIDLLMRVTRVSVETQAVVDAMAIAPR